jgi:hypothetical protein
MPRRGGGEVHLRDALAWAEDLATVDTLITAGIASSRAEVLHRRSAESAVSSVLADS